MVNSGHHPKGQIQARLDSIDRMVQDLLFFAEPPPRLATVSVRVVMERAVVLWRGRRSSH